MKLSDIAKKMLLVVCLALPVIVLAGYAYYRTLEFLPFAYGALLGTVLNAAKIFMLDRAVGKIPGMDAVKAGNYVRAQHLLRLVITGLVLVAAVYVPFINVWGAVAGVSMYQIAVYSLKFFNKDEKSDQTNRQ